MALQIRISTPSFSSGISFTNPIILERADDIALAKTVNSNNESISFNLPLNDPKMQYITYLNWWECWDTETNQRLNYGPIRTIERTSGESKRIGGPGRSALLEDYYKSVQTFYYPINQFLDDLRYENLSDEPRTSTIINKNTASDYYGLSMRTKDRAIDGQTGYITVGRDTPIKGTIKTDSYWTGVAKNDHLIVDLGDEYVVSKSRVLLPWWGGVTINANRSYDWNYLYSSNNSSYTNAYSSPVPNYQIMSPELLGTTLYFGESGFEYDQRTAVGSPVTARYWKLDITNTHAWYGNAFLGTLGDGWEWECNQSNVLLGESYESPTISGGIIPTDEISPASDCHASAIELSLYRKIVNRDTISNLSYVQIENDNRQITYDHVVAPSEMISAGSEVKYEPGPFFRKVSYEATGTTDVKNEYNILLDNNVVNTLSLPAFTRLLKFSNPTAKVTRVDTWKGLVDAFSYGGSYQYSTTIGDTAILHFRGVSVKWYATIPDGVTAGSASIELRSKSANGTWSNWSTLEASLTLPTDVSAYKVWEITPESGTLSDDTIYELRITNLNGGYVSIDAFTGYWSASFSNIEEDDARFKVRSPSDATQLFDGKFTGGSIYQYPDIGWTTKQSYPFTGDRAIVYSRKGPGYGILRIALFQITPSGTTLIPIPGYGNYIDIDLNNTYDISQAIVFDTNELFLNPGLPWDYYYLGIYKPDDADPIWLDGLGVHQTTGLSVKFMDTNYLDILMSTAEALNMEWDILESGIKVVPRIGTDTDIIFAEGRGTTIKIPVVEDVSKVATMLVVTGADIEGLPLSAVVEDKNTKKLFGRTIQRLYDLRNVGDYFTLIGAARTELLRRKEPERRITVETTDIQGIITGDSFIIKTPELEQRVRAITITRNQSSSGGTSYTMECLKWPQIV